MSHNVTRTPTDALQLSTEATLTWLWKHVHLTVIAAEFAIIVEGGRVGERNFKNG